MALPGGLIGVCFGPPGPAGLGDGMAIGWKSILRSAILYDWTKGRSSAENQVQANLFRESEQMMSAVVSTRRSVCWCGGLAPRYDCEMYCTVAQSFVCAQRRLRAVVIRMRPPTSATTRASRDRAVGLAGLTGVVLRLFVASRSCLVRAMRGCEDESRVELLFEPRRTASLGLSGLTHDRRRA